MGEKWVLCECGFDQRLFEGEGRANGGGSVREVCRFSGEPVLVISCVWDGCHVYAKTSSKLTGTGDGDEKAVSFSSGRWKPLLERLQEELGGESVVEVMEIGSEMYVTTISHRLLCASHDQHIRQVSSAPEHLHQVEKPYSVQGGTLTYAILTNRQVYLATINSNAYLELTTPILPEVPIKQVACGTDHVILLSRENGRVWSSGLNHRGQLGHGDILPRPHPSLLEALDGVCIVGVSCGNWHSLAVSVYGDVYSWGWNADHQLGHSLHSPTVATPALVDVEAEVNFKQVSCGSRHSVALTECGVVYTWGWNAHGQLGRPDSTQHPSPLALSSGGVVSHVQCTPWSTLFLLNQH